MRKLALFLLVAAAIPASADSIPRPIQIPSSEVVVIAPATRCYFIRQLNRQIQAPMDKPKMMPLADVTKLSTPTPFANCMPDQRATKIAVK